MTSLMRKDVYYPALSALLLGLSLPPLPCGFLAWIALIPLFISLQDCSLKEAIRRGLLFALIFNLISLHFISLNNGATFIIAVASYLVTALFLSLFGAIFALPMWLAGRKFGIGGLLFAPFFWAGMEYLKSVGEIAAPWNISPLSQSYYLPLIQIVSITGIWGISFWIAVINSLLILGWKRTRRWFIIMALWIIAPFICGGLILEYTEPPRQKVSIAIIQGNVSPEEKWANSLESNLDLYRRLTLTAPGADMAVWPEAAVPANLNVSLQGRNYLRSLAAEYNRPILTGALAREYASDGEVKSFNSAFLVRPGVYDFPRYDKIHLVPGGERIPFQKIFPALGKLNFGQAEFTPGQKYTIFPLDSLDLGVMICFESIFSPIARRFTSEGADFLVNITNDGWYDKCAEPYQQALLTRFRAVENRRSMVRAANTGISYLMDGYGRFLVKSELEKEAVLTAEIPIYRGNTFYSRSGDVFAQAVLLISGIIVILCIITGRRRAKLITAALLLLVFTAQSSSGEDRYLTLSTVDTRSLSLGSPAAMEGGLMSPPINPAGLTIFRNSPLPRISIFLNPLGAGAAIYGMQEGKYADTTIKADDFIIPAALLIKAIGFSYQPLNVGVIFGEQMPGGWKQDDFIEYYPLFDNYFNRAFLKFQLAEKVQIGASAEIFAKDDKIDAVGYSYGILMRPGKINVGVFYHTSPPGYENEMLHGQRLVNETINAGLSYRPVKMIKFYCGMRNLSESKSKAFMEIHSGLEFTPFEHIGLRAGYYLESGEKNSFSLGIGLIDVNEFRNLQDRTDIAEYLIEYSISKLPEENTLQAFSLHFRL